tara:strand:- start:78 stop:671 length:594 start_codon:yes stop_codon:yes gene_type:complete
MEEYQIVNFVEFLLKRVYNSKQIPKTIVLDAFNNVIRDVNYHFPETGDSEVLNRIVTNQNELAMFLFRLGSQIHKENLEELESQIHFLMKDLCGCEIYFNSTIDEGLYIVHGEGTIIGSRNTIGKGFMIHQNCTIGHKVNGSGSGNNIGENVKMYCNSSILGSLYIGDNVVIGAHTMVNKNIKDNTTVISNTRLDYL